MKKLLLIALLVASAAHAQQYPTKPVRMVIHIGPGSSMDIVGRVLAQKLNEAWAQPVIVDNRAGAGGTIGIDVVAKAPPDGYTILFGSSSLAIAASYYRKLPYDTLRDFEPITQISSRHNVLVVAPSSPYHSVKDVIAAAKAKPGQLSYGSGGGSGSSDHLAGELFKMMAGIDLLHVPYKSGPAAL
jgi:tripartite-type tricarboxylate transporter receptor subunit TctC